MPRYQLARDHGPDDLSDVTPLPNGVPIRYTDHLISTGKSPYHTLMDTLTVFEHEHKLDLVRVVRETYQMWRETIKESPLTDRLVKAGKGRGSRRGRAYTPEVRRAYLAYRTAVREALQAGVSVRAIVQQSNIERASVVRAWTSSINTVNLNWERISERLLLGQSVREIAESRGYAVGPVRNFALMCGFIEGRDEWVERTFEAQARLGSSRKVAIDSWKHMWEPQGWTYATIMEWCAQAANPERRAQRAKWLSNDRALAV